jgi:hypothetical protein
MTADPRRLFDLLDSDEVERRALGVVTTADRLAAEEAAWAEELTARGEWFAGGGRAAVSALVEPAARLDRSGGR